MNTDARKAVTLLDHQGVPFSLTGSTVMTPMRTTAVPANAMRSTGSLRIWLAFDFTNNANAKTIQVTFGGQVVLSLQPTTNAYLSRWLHIVAKGVTNAQSVEPNTAVSALGYQTIGSQVLTVDTTQNQNIVVNGQLANSADNLTLTQYYVELLNFA